MNKAEFFAEYGSGLVVAQEDSAEYGDYLFLHPEEISKVQEFDPAEYHVVAVHETEDGEDFVEMGQIDYGSQPYKYGYYVIKNK